MSYLLPIIFLTFIILATVSIIWGRRLQGSPKVLLLHSVQTEKFEALLKLVNDAGLSVGTVEESLRDRTKVAITFDDGYEDLMQIVPLLKRQQIPIMVFVPTAYIEKPNDWDHLFAKGRRRHLSEEQIRELAGLGAQFGSHGHNHRDLTLLSNAEIHSEIDSSKWMLASFTGQEIKALAFPFGRSNSAVRQAVRKVGIELQFGSSPLSISGESLGRIPITEFDNSFTIRRKLHGGIVAGVEALKAVIVSRFSHLTPVARRAVGAS